LQSYIVQQLEKMKNGNKNLMHWRYG